MIVNNPISTELAQEFAKHKLALKEVGDRNTNTFNTLKKDLESIIKENKIKILTHTSPSSNKFNPTRHKAE